MIDNLMKRLEMIAVKYSDNPPTGVEKRSALDKIDTIKTTTEFSFTEKEENDGMPSNLGTSKAWFMEKVTSACTFARMAVEESEREGYSPESIRENTQYYAYLAASRFNAW